MTRFSSTLSRRRRGRGIALLEAMIGVLIFAFGVLGLMGLQAAMTKAQTAAKFRSDAASLASDLFSLIQTDNPANIGNYASKTCGKYDRCADWLNKVNETLPGELLPEIAVNTGTGQVDVVIKWQQGTEGASRYATGMVWQQ